MRRYETILITHADLAEDELTGFTDRFGSIVTAQKGILVKIERWGKRKLAYLIRKQSRGFYILIDYAGDSATVNELERNLKIEDKVLKFMTIQKEEKVDPAALEKELAEAAKQKTDAAHQGTEAAPIQAVPAAAPQEVAAPVSQESQSETQGEKAS